MIFSYRNNGGAAYEGNHPGTEWSVCEALPTVCTVSNLLNRQDYRLRTAVKTKVQKKTAETDAIF